MKRIIIIVLAAALLLIGVGAVQDWQNTPERGCTKYDSAPLYWQYTCKDGSSFYEQK